MTTTVIPNAFGGDGGTMTQERQHQQHPHPQTYSVNTRIGATNHNQPNTMPRFMQQNGGHSQRNGRGFEGGRTAAPSGAVMVSGNQVMLQRQNHTTQAPLQKQRQTQLQQQRPQQQRRHHTEQENVGSISMMEVMQNLRMLEQQQVEAREKLVESRQVKVQELDLQKQQQSLLEGKIFANGQACGELDKYHDFLSFASRKMKDRKFISAHLDKDINEFHRHLEGGIKSSQMIKVTETMVDTILVAIKKKVHALSVAKHKCSTVLKNEMDKYEKTKQKEQQLRSSIHNLQADAQKLASRSNALSTEVANLELDKSDIDAKAEELKKELVEIRDEIKTEELRFEDVQKATESEMAEAALMEESLQNEISDAERTLVELELALELEKKEIVGLVENEGWEMEDLAPTSCFARMTSAETVMDDEYTVQLEEISVFERQLQEMEKELKSIETATHAKEEESNDILAQVEAIEVAIGKQKSEANEVESHLAHERSDYEALEAIYIEMKDVRRKEEEELNLEEAAIMAKQSEMYDYLQSLQMEAKVMKQKMAANAKHFEHIEMPALERHLEETITAAEKAAADYNEIRLQTDELDLPDDDEVEYQTYELLQQFPHLENLVINIKYNPKRDFKKQLKTAIFDLKMSKSKSGDPYKAKTFGYYFPQDFSIPEKDTDYQKQPLQPHVLTRDERFKMSAEKAAVLGNRVVPKMRNKKTESKSSSNKDMMEDIFGEETKTTFAGPPAGKRVRWEESDSEDDMSPLTDMFTQPNDLLISHDNSLKSKERKHSKKSTEANRSIKSVLSTQNSTKNETKDAATKACRRSRKKSQSGMAEKSSLSFTDHDSKIVDTTSVLEKLSQQHPSKQPIQKRKVSASETDRTSKGMYSQNDSQTYGALEDAGSRKRHKQCRSVDGKTTTDSRKQYRSTHVDQKEGVKSTKDQDTKHPLEKTSTYYKKSDKEMSSKNGNVEQCQKKTGKTKALGTKSTKERKAFKDRRDDRSKDTSTKSIEETKSSRIEKDKTSDTRQASKGNEKSFRDERDKKRKASRSDQTESSRLKKDPSRKKSKASSSSTSLVKGDDASRASKASKSRRSRKKVANTSGMSTKIGTMDDDYGFNF